MTPPMVDDDEFKNVNSGNPPLWIPEGIYPAQLVDREITSTPWGEKLVFSWNVFISTEFRDAEMRNERPYCYTATTTSTG